MRKSVFVLIILFFLASAAVCAENEEPVKLNGISLGISSKDLIDNWGYPSKREYKKRAEIWYYLDEETPQPVDGVVVFFKRGRVAGWKAVENIYEEMDIWGAKVSAGD